LRDAESIFDETKIVNQRFSFTLREKAIDICRTAFDPRVINLLNDYPLTDEAAALKIAMIN
jgi:hypothetical protein